MCYDTIRERLVNIKGCVCKISSVTFMDRLKYAFTPLNVKANLQVAHESLIKQNRCLVDATIRNNYHIDMREVKK